MPNHRCFCTPTAAYFAGVKKMMFFRLPCSGAVMQTRFVSGVVHRLWHSSPPVAQIDNIHIDDSNYTGIKTRLLRSLLLLGASSLSAPTPYYRHSYGAFCSV